MPEQLDLSKLDTDRIPAHVGIILDGNGRWANARGLERTSGHLAGEEALFDTVNGALEIGLPWLTVYTFSTENWTRSSEEVEFLMWFNEDLLLRRRDSLHERGVHVHFAGDRHDSRIPDHNKGHMIETEELTADNHRLDLVFAFNYGARTELVEAVRSIAESVADGEFTPAEIDESTVADHLYVPEMPDADLIVRTSGELRLSNFLLWQAAYAELIFTDVLWPDFTAQSLVDAIVEYQQRRRRFGRA